MSTPTRLLAFAAALVATIGLGVAVGAAVGPIESSTSSHGAHEESGSTGDTHDSHDGDDQASNGDYRLAIDQSVIRSGEATAFTFRVLGPDGSPVTAFDDNHERPMHLIMVSNDVTGYAHLHPSLDADGTWRIELPPMEPGAHRLFADVVPSGGQQMVLTADLVVPGQGTAAALPEPAGATRVDDLDVTLDLAKDGDDVVAVLDVDRAGVAIEPDPYLGARGHLVAIAVDDLGYLHVHPVEARTGDGEVRFVMSDPRPGRYRLFFDFSVDDRVRTAAFTVDLPPEKTSEPTTGHTHAPGEEHP